MVDPTRDMVEILTALNHMAEYKGPEALTPPGEQVEMFRPCLYCGRESHMASLPQTCPGCHQTLRRLVHLPVIRGPAWLRRNGRYIRFVLYLWLVRMQFVTEMSRVPLIGLLLRSR